MNILICDDLADAAVQLSKIISLSFPDADIRSFAHAGDVLDFIRSGKIPDISFLDIIMPEMDGVLLAEKMREEGYKGPIVFLSSANNYAAQSYKVSAFSYLLKPPKENEVIDILLKVEKAIKDNDTTGLQINTKRLTRFILHRDISHVEVINQKVHFHLIDGSDVEIWAPLSEIAPRLLSDNRFAKCHNAFVVNLDHVSYIRGNAIIMKNGRNMPITRRFNDIKKLYENKLF